MVQKTRKKSTSEMEFTSRMSYWLKRSNIDPDFSARHYQNFVNHTNKFVQSYIYQAPAMIVKTKALLVNIHIKDSF